MCVLYHKKRVKKEKVGWDQKKKKKKKKRKGKDHIEEPCVCARLPGSVRARGGLPGSAGGPAGEGRPPEKLLELALAKLLFCRLRNTDGGLPS